MARYVVSYGPGLPRRSATLTPSPSTPRAAMIGRLSTPYHASDMGTSSFASSVSPTSMTSSRSPTARRSAVSPTICNTGPPPMNAGESGRTWIDGATSSIIAATSFARSAVASRWAASTRSRSVWFIASSTGFGGTLSSSSWRVVNQTSVVTGVDSPTCATLSRRSRARRWYLSRNAACSASRRSSGDHSLPAGSTRWPASPLAVAQKYGVTAMPRFS